MKIFSWLFFLVNRHPLKMRSWSFLIELVDPGCWTMRFFRPASGKVRFDPTSSASLPHHYIASHRFHCYIILWFVMYSPPSKTNIKWSTVARYIGVYEKRTHPLFLILSCKSLTILFRCHRVHLGLSHSIITIRQNYVGEIDLRFSNPVKIFVILMDVFCFIPTHYQTF